VKSRHVENVRQPERDSLRRALRLERCRTVARRRASAGAWTPRRYRRSFLGTWPAARSDARAFHRVPMTTPSRGGSYAAGGAGIQELRVASPPNEIVSESAVQERVVRARRARALSALTSGNGQAV
jgi:hypothetical protein